jgi:hypothetical protein
LYFFNWVLKFLKIPLVFCCNPSPPPPPPPPVYLLDGSRIDGFGPGLKPCGLEPHEDLNPRGDFPAMKGSYLN